MKLPEHALIILDVLEDVERGCNIEFGIEREVACVELEERDARQSLPRDQEPFDEQVGSSQLHVRALIVESTQHVAGPTADLEQRLCLRKVPPERPDKELLSATEPEARRLERGELLEHLAPEPMRFGGKLRC